MAMLGIGIKVANAARDCARGRYRCRFTAFISIVRCQEALKQGMDFNREKLPVYALSKTGLKAVGLLSGLTLAIGRCNMDLVTD